MMWRGASSEIMGGGIAHYILDKDRSPESCSSKDIHKANHSALYDSLPLTTWIDFTIIPLSLSHRDDAVAWIPLFRIFTLSTYGIISH